MARLTNTPTLTPANRLYLYRLLADELGRGVQTFLPAVEEALASDAMTADDLGYESTRALLEDLDVFIKLTVFKGGRIYATVIAQPEWDAALAAPEPAKTAASAKGNKPWKKKKADKQLKPVRPKRVKRPEPEPVAEAPAEVPGHIPSGVACSGQTSSGHISSGRGYTKRPTEICPEQAAASTSADSAKRSSGICAEQDTATEIDASSVPVSASVEEAEPQSELGVKVELEIVSEVEAETDMRPVVEPAISLTVTYDPYSGIDEETVLVSNPVVAAAPTPAATAAAEPIATPEPAMPEPGLKPISSEHIPGGRFVKPRPKGICSEQLVKPHPKEMCSEQPPLTENEPLPVAQQPMRPSPEALASYPANLATEVYLASEVVAELCELLPYGTDVFTLLAEDYQRSRDLELIGGTRSKATFPLRIEHAASTEPIVVTLKKRNGSGLRWELAGIA